MRKAFPSGVVLRAAFSPEFSVGCRGGRKIPFGATPGFVAYRSLTDAHVLIGTTPNTLSRLGRTDFESAEYAGLNVRSAHKRAAQ